MPIVYIFVTILEKLFTSPDRITLIQFYLFHPEISLSAKEVAKRLRARHLVNGKVLKEFVRSGCLMEGVNSETGDTTYQINHGWILFPELRALFVKAQLLVEHDLVRRLQKTGKLNLLILSGLFTGDRASATDALIVGQIKKQRLASLLKSFERDLSDEVRYTLMTPAEYRYRKDIGDRFIYDVLERRHLVVVDTTQRAIKGTKRKIGSK